MKKMLILPIYANSVCYCSPFPACNLLSKHCFRFAACNSITIEIILNSQSCSANHHVPKSLLVVCMNTKSLYTSPEGRYLHLCALNPTKALEKYEWPKEKRNARQKCNLFLKKSLHF